MHFYICRDCKLMLEYIILYFKHNKKNLFINNYNNYQLYIYIYKRIEEEKNHIILKFSMHYQLLWLTDLAFEILRVEPSIAYAVNELGITPLHLLASKPSVFKSGSHFGWWKSIIYHCKYYSIA